VHISSAGHILPVVAAQGQPAEPADIQADLPGGVAADAPRHLTSVELPPGTLLCLCADGLLECKDYPLDDSMARLSNRNSATAGGGLHRSQGGAGRQAKSETTPAFLSFRRLPAVAPHSWQGSNPSRPPAPSMTNRPKAPTRTTPPAAISTAPGGPQRQRIRATGTPAGHQPRHQPGEEDGGSRRGPGLPASSPAPDTGLASAR
jgi:hypothetical protein